MDWVTVDEESVRGRFARMAEFGSLDPAEPHCWEYRAGGPSPADLKRLGDRLTEQGFTVQEPRVVPGSFGYCMSMERVQIHTPESMIALWRELAALAEEYGVNWGDYSVR